MLTSTRAAAMNCRHKVQIQAILAEAGAHVSAGALQAARRKGSRGSQKIQNQTPMAWTKMQILRNGEVDARFATTQLHSQTCSQLNPAAAFFHWLPGNIKSNWFIQYIPLNIFYFFFLANALLLQNFFSLPTTSPDCCRINLMPV